MNTRSKVAPSLPLKLSVNLASAALLELDFLKQIDDLMYLYEPEVISAAIFRYETFWLPLLDDTNNAGNLTPPLDVHWVWHTHMLSPRDYKKDCSEVCNGKHFQHVLKRREDFDNQQSAAKQIWVQKYPLEPFDLDVQTVRKKYAFTVDQYEQKCGYNIKEAALRQQAFYYQVFFQIKTVLLKFRLFCRYQNTLMASDKALALKEIRLPQQLPYHQLLMCNAF